MEATQITVKWAAPWLCGYHPSSPVNSTVDLAADTVQEPELLFPSHQEEPSLFLRACTEPKPMPLGHSFCQAQAEGSSWVVFFIFLQVNGGKMRQRKRLELERSPFCSCFIFFSSVSDFFESKEKGRISTKCPLTSILGCHAAVVELLSLRWLLPVILIFLGELGVLFQTKAGDLGQWLEFLS